MPEIVHEEKLAETPADVAALYAWAHMEGIQYKDFSAERRVAREEARRRGALARQKAAGPATAVVAEPVRSAHPVSDLLAGAQSAPTAGEIYGRNTGKESMLPQRFPRRRQAKELTATGLSDTPQTVGADASLASAPGMPRVGQRVRNAAGEQTAFREKLTDPGAAAPASQTMTPEQEQPALRERPRVRRSIPVPSGESEPTRSAREQAQSGLPAWLTEAPGQEAVSPKLSTDSPVSDTLQDSRERVASRWYALRGVFDPAVPAMEPTQAHVRMAGSSVLAIFSLAGGVGKTSLTAAIGRALSSQGENVLLAEVSAHGLLPFFFGATDPRVGVVRKFLPPPGSNDAPISLLSYELGRGEKVEAIGKSLETELVRGREQFDRILVDLSPMAPEMIRPLLEQDANVLVPVAPDMNAVIGLAAVERFFAELRDAGGRPVQPRYVLTQFDPSQPLHLDVREVMRQQLEDRLLPFVIRRAPSVAEALAEGMTVIDYAPDAGVSADHRELATWVQNIAQRTSAGRMPSRWSER